MTNVKLFLQLLLFWIVAAVVSCVFYTLVIANSVYRRYMRRTYYRWRNAYRKED